MEGQGVTMGKWRLKGKGKETREEGRRHCLPYSQFLRVLFNSRVASGCLLHGNSRCGAVYIWLF